MRRFSYSKAHDTPSAVAQHSQAFCDDPDGGGAAFLAGGTTLIDLMKLDVMRPGHLVDIGGLKAAHGEIRLADDGALHLGAMVTMSDAARHADVLALYPVLAQSLLLAASPQIRNRATLGGNVLQRTRCPYYRNPDWLACNKRRPGSGCEAVTGPRLSHAILGASASCVASYPGDFAQALLALDADVTIAGLSGERTIPFAELHRLPGSTPHVETNLGQGELLTSFRIPHTPWGRRSLYVKIRDRQSYEFALASVAIVLDLDGLQVKNARIAIGGLATIPWRAREAEQALVGRRISEEEAVAASEIAFRNAVATDSGDHKVRLGKATLVRALLEACALDVR